MGGRQEERSGVHMVVSLGDYPISRSEKAISVVNKLGCWGIGSLWTDALLSLLG